MVWTEALVVDAFAHLGLLAQPPDEARQGVDLVVEPYGVAVPLRISRRSLVDKNVVAGLPYPVRSDGVSLLVIADRVTEAARDCLTRRGSGYYDLRGRLALRSSSIIIDARLPPVSERPDRTHSLSGRAGLEVATALLMSPKEGARVRELARRLDRSASTVSETLALLRHADLVDTQHAVVDFRLFWEVADRWVAPRKLLSRTPPPFDHQGITKPLRLGLADVSHETGWALTDSVAAAAYGAALAVRSDQRLDFYVPDSTTARRAVTLLGSADSEAQAQGAVKVAPVPWVCARRVDLASNPHEWPLAHPLFVALDLAQDAGRGHDILQAWTPGGAFERVW